MRARLLDYSRDPNQVFDCESEKNELHRLIRHDVVLAQSVLSALDALLNVEDLLVRPLRHPVRNEQVSEKQASDLVQLVDPPVAVDIQVSEGGVEAGGEGRPHGVLDGLEHPQPVFVVDEPVPEHPDRLVRPQPDGCVHRRTLGLVAHADPHDHLGEVPQVERVVRLRGGRFQVHLDVVVNLHRRAHDLVLHSGHLLVEPIGAVVPV
mmetsp:Transcript_42407/g.49470  ORF Transcript_42407/g.49470 Transcript_42407/m.49470 type:complete len:207 (-) Transcript_42407:6272-6892(-)